jgi:hypothetical protein
MYAALASQKRYCSLYLSAVYADPERQADFEARYRETGKRLDMGKSCVRFRTLDDLPLDLDRRHSGRRVHHDLRGRPSALTRRRRRNSLDLRAAAAS